MSTVRNASVPKADFFAESANGHQMKVFPSDLEGNPLVVVRTPTDENGNSRVMLGNARFLTKDEKEAQEAQAQGQYVDVDDLFFVVDPQTQEGEVFSLREVSSSRGLIHFFVF